MDSTPETIWQSSTLKDPCGACIDKNKGIPPKYAKTFNKPLAQLRDSIDRLDRPLAPNRLRSSLATIRLIFVHILNNLGIPELEIGSDVEYAVQQETRESINQIPESDSNLRSGLERLSCPERYLGSKAGYPRYKTGFTTINCSASPLNKVITILLWDVEPSRVPKILSDIDKVYQNLTIFIITNKTESYYASNISPSVKIYKSMTSLQSSIKELIKNVTTPYVVLAPRIFQVTTESRLERLIWAAEWIGVWAVGGAVKTQDGKWQSSCLAAKKASGQIIYHRGYTSSIYECQLCNMIDGPIVARTKWLKSNINQWPKEDISPSLLLPDLFLQLNENSSDHKHSSAVCPDALFHTTSPIVPWSSSKSNKISKHSLHRLWSTIAKKKKLARIVLPSGEDLRYGCHYLLSKNNVNTTYNSLPSPKINVKSRTMEWACQEAELKEMLQHTILVCKTSNLKCLLQGNARQG